MSRFPESPPNSSVGSGTGHAQRVCGAGVGCSGAGEPGGAAASPLPVADPERKVGQGAGGGGPRARVAEQGREERREEGTGACHSRAPSVHRGCAEWCASRQRPSRIRRRAAHTAGLCSSASPEAPQSPRAPDLASRSGYGRLLYPRVSSRLLSGAGQRC